MNRFSLKFNFTLPTYLVPQCIWTQAWHCVNAADKLIFGSGTKLTVHTSKSPSLVLVVFNVFFCSATSQITKTILMIMMIICSKIVMFCSNSSKTDKTNNNPVNVFMCVCGGVSVWRMEWVEPIIFICCINIMLNHQRVNSYSEDSRRIKKHKQTCQFNDGSQWFLNGANLLCEC